MATIELDIIKQRSEKLLPAEKIELIEDLAASLSPEQREQVLRSVGSHGSAVRDRENSADNDTISS